jgi:proteasome lid subunit RPN8/RPN11
LVIPFPFCESFLRNTAKKIGTTLMCWHGNKIMNIRGIRQELLSLLLEMGRNNHPNEFVTLLREREGIIEEMNMLPGTVAGEDSASLLFDMMPLDTHLAGSAHSHPNGVLRPSNADVNFFPRTGRYHLIICYPYRESDWQCFTADGNPHNLEVIV